MILEPILAYIPDRLSNISLSGIKTRNPIRIRYLIFRTLLVINSMDPFQSMQLLNSEKKNAATTLASSEKEVAEKKPTERRTRKKVTTKKEQDMCGDSSELEESTSATPYENEMEELQLREDEGEDISFTYAWPPLVCCFGAAQHLFIPSGRPANRLIDHEIHESMKDMFWTPTKFVRAPGSSPSNVAIALAAIGGRVAFMGKLGDDEYGQELLYHLNVNKVQTRSIVMDTSTPTAVSQMKIMRRGGLRLSCVKPCAEDSFTVSEININILKEVITIL